ncbi:MAG: DUF2065 domain-containing protein [Pseudomonadota bacterium]
MLTALALALILEGLLPFAGPGRYRRMVDELARLSDNQLRIVGLAVMLAGLLLLYFVRA